MAKVVYATVRIQSTTDDQERQSCTASEAWLRTSCERRATATVAASAFSFSAACVLAIGLIALAGAGAGDVEALGDRLAQATCLRATRHADYVSVLLSLGSPKQELRLLWRPDKVADGSDQLQLWSERMHKSTTLLCENFAPGLQIAHARNCSDLALVYHGQIDKLSTTPLQFTFKSDAVAVFENSVAAQLGFDGELRLAPETTYWLTTSHLCMRDAPDILDGAGSGSGTDAASGDTDAGSGSGPDIPGEALLFEYAGFEGRATARLGALRSASATADLRLAEACAGLGRDTVVDIFPVYAGVEVSWLHLSSSFLRTQAYDELEARRDVVELGTACVAEHAPALARAASTYSLDCGIVATSTACRTTPSVPFRRVAHRRLQLDVGAELLATDGLGAVAVAVVPATLRTEPAKVLEQIPSLLPHSEGALRAFGRLFVLLLVAAVVFVRGSQNAASARFTLSRTLDRLHCRGDYAHVSLARQLFPSSWSERVTDLSISLLALVSRTTILVTSAEALVADGVGIVVASELLGIVASAIHLTLRYAQQFDGVVESPLGLMAGPMSIVDVCAAVLVIFSDAPLLSDENSRFSAIGRLLISLLIAIAVFPRCHFGASVCAAMASACRNGPDRRDLGLFQAALGVATVCWVVEGAVVSAAVCTLFVAPAAYAMSRSLVGATWPFRYTVFLGLLCTGLPATNKVLLKVWERECEHRKAKAA